MQSVGDLLRYLLPLPPAGGLPDAKLLFADRRLVAARFHRQQKAVRDRVRHSQHCGIGHTSFPPPLGSVPGASLESRSFSQTEPAFNAESPLKAKGFPERHVRLSATFSSFSSAVRPVRPLPWRRDRTPECPWNASAVRRCRS